MKRRITGPARQVLTALLDLSPQRPEQIARATGLRPDTVHRVLARCREVDAPVRRRGRAWTLLAN